MTRIYDEWQFARDYIILFMIINIYATDATYESKFAASMAGGIKSLHYSRMNRKSIAASMTD